MQLHHVHQGESDPSYFQQTSGKPSAECGPWGWSCCCVSILALLFPTTLAGFLPVHFQGLLEPAWSREGLQEGRCI